MNKVILIGRITKDLELRKINNDKAVCEFSLAVNRDKEKTDFINCIVWNKQAENLVKYQGKGSLISITGELRVDSFEIKGEKRYKTYVLVENIEFLQKIEKKEENPFENFGNKVETQVQEEFQYSDEDLPWL